MIEDEVYRTSSQYRYWSYTRASLERLREDTNRLASTRVRIALQAPQKGKDAGKNGEDPSDESGATAGVATLTVDEELKIVEFGCQKIIEMGEVMKPPIPMDIRATAIQYLRRFYLTNSPMTYHPKQIMMCALYLATKADHWHVSLNKFVAELPGVTEEQIKAPEFLLLQGLRFTLDVRHPMRGLDGGVMEMKAMASDGLIRPNITSRASIESHVDRSASRAQKLLRSAAQMTDVYFLFTPSQIWLAALHVSDPDLTEEYLQQKMDSLGEAGNAMREKLLTTVLICATMLKAYESAEDAPEKTKEIRRIGKKLHLCQNPEKMDIVAATKAKAAEKREGGEPGDVDKAVKKRKLERESLEKDGDVFGPEMRSVA